MTILLIIMNHIRDGGEAFFHGAGWGGEGCTERLGAGAGHGGAGVAATHSQLVALAAVLASEEGDQYTLHSSAQSTVRHAQYR